MIEREEALGEINILESNADAFELFVRSQTQWTRDSMGRLQGFNYIGVEFVAGKLGIELDAANFRRLQTLESAAKDLANDGSGE